MAIAAIKSEYKAGRGPTLEGALKFDPRQLPRLPADNGLPLLPAQALQGRQLQRFFAKPIQFPVEQSVVATGQADIRAPAAVLIGILEAESGHPQVLFTQRTATLSDHAGQIAFPGGKVDTTDSNPCACAVREAWEEVGLASDFIDILGCLPTYATPKYDITPVLAFVRPGFTLKPNPAEVAHVFQVPLAFLMNPRNHHKQTYKHKSWFAMPYHQTSVSGIQEHYIWGVSAGILRNFYHFLRYSYAAQLQPQQWQ